MDEASSGNLPLEARPKWIVTHFLKWLSIVLGAALLLFFVAILIGVVFYSRISFPSDVSTHEIMDQYYVVIDWVDFFIEARFLVPSILLLWFLALIAEKVDEIVWLNASREDQDAILAKRGKSVTAT